MHSTMISEARNGIPGTLPEAALDPLQGRNGVFCFQTESGWQGWVRRGNRMWGEQDASLHQLAWRLLLLGEIPPQNVEEMAHSRAGHYILVQIDPRDRQEDS